MADRELRRLAASYLVRERSGHTLQPTALVNEAYLRLIGQNEKMDWESRSHFVAIAAQHMRQILVDHARRHIAGKRGGGIAMVALDDLAVGSDGPSADLLAVDEAHRAAESLRFFGGSLPEARHPQTS